MKEDFGLSAEQRILEQGEVVQADEKNAVVRIFRSSACGSCSACGLSSDKKYIDLSVQNTLKAVCGDKVELSINKVSATKVSLIVYLIPLVVAIVVLFVTTLLNAPDYVSVICFLLGLGGGFFVVRAIDKKYGKSIGVQPILTKIIKENKDEQNSN